MDKCKLREKHKIIRCEPGNCETCERVFNWTEKIKKEKTKEILNEAKKWVKVHYKDKVTDSFGEREMLFMEAFGCLFKYLKEKYNVEIK